MAVSSSDDLTVVRPPENVQRYVDNFAELAHDLSA